MTTPSTASARSGPLAVLISVFFFWGFLAASNGIFIPFCKSYYNLTQLQSQWIDFAFYAAYFLGSLLLFSLEVLTKNPILNKIGYKNGIIYGLLVSAAGALSMYFALQSASYAFILGSFFIIAMGFSLQQTCAQPFVIALGNPETGAHRLNLAGGINSFGTMVGPLILNYFLFKNTTIDTKDVSLSDVGILFWVLAGIFAAVALMFSIFKLPKVTSPDALSNGWDVLKYPQLTLGMVAIFMYVGVEVTVQSNLGALLALPEFGGLKESDIAPYISLYWGSLMIGRWTGAIKVFNLSQQLRRVLTIVVPIVAFGIIVGANEISGKSLLALYPYLLCITVLIGAFFLGEEKPGKTLYIFGVLGAVAMVIGLITSGQTAIYAFLSGGLFCSVMWPCIFALATAGLNEHTSKGSMLLIMMILGGACIPPLQGWMADTQGIHISYTIPVICFAYLAFYGWYSRQLLRKQGINWD